MVERKRHFVKALTYRVLGSLGSAGIGYFATGSFSIGATIGFTDAIAKIGVYYIHERIWYRIKWGVRPSPPQIVATQIAPPIVSKPASVVSDRA